MIHLDFWSQQLIKDICTKEIIEIGPENFGAHMMPVQDHELVPFVMQVCIRGNHTGSTRRVEREEEFYANYGTDFRFPHGCECHLCSASCCDVMLPV
jgi:hypothetical protein